MIQTPMINPYVQTPSTPSYNAVKIDVHNPSVNAPGAVPSGVPQYNYTPQYAPVTAPQYNYPQAQLYNYPNYPQTAGQAYYLPPHICPPQGTPCYVCTPVQPQQAVALLQQPQETAQRQVPPKPETAPVNYNIPAGIPGAAPDAWTAPATAAAIAPAAAAAALVPSAVTTAALSPAVANPQVVQQNYNSPVVPQPVITQVSPAAPTVTTTTVTPEATGTISVPQQPGVVPPVTIPPQVDLNGFIARLTNSDFEVQAAAMEEIANMVKEKPETAAELLDEKVIGSLTSIINADSTKLAGPTPEQVAARQKLMSNKTLSEEEKTLAMSITPMEQAERNKSYALFTTAILQKLYGDEVTKLTGNVVPLTELPGAVTVVENLKANENPMVRTSAIEALSYIQNPAYKQDLTTVFTIAQNDIDPNVREAAKTALTKLGGI